MTSTDDLWASATFGLRIEHLGGAAPINDLVLPGLRRNPRRAHLLVSTVLGKHIAVAPDAVISAGERLGALVAPFIDGDVDVLGMAETATSLGHCVANRLDAAMYLHTTRRAASRAVYAEFQEGHSHATNHTLQPTSSQLLSRNRPLVIVDDEISTGATALAAIEALHHLTARPLYIVASLVDVRAASHREAAALAAQRLGTNIVFVSLATGRVCHPRGLAATVCAMEAPKLNVPTSHPRGILRRVDLPWPSTVPDGGRHGVLRGDRPRFISAVEAAARALAAHLDLRRSVLIVGHEELMFLPLRLAENLQRRGADVRFQSTTRSPAYVYDHPGYPLRVGYQFPACEPGEGGRRYLYNGWRGEDCGSPQVVLVMDAIAAAGIPPCGTGVVDILATAGYDVTVAVVATPSIDELADQRRQLS